MVESHQPGYGARQGSPITRREKPIVMSIPPRDHGRGSDPSDHEADGRPLAGSATAMPVQIGHSNHQYNSWIHGDDRTVKLEILTEQDPISLRPGVVVPLTVMARNAGPGPVEVSLDVVGALSSSSTIEPSRLRLLPGADSSRCVLRLNGGRNAPEASRYDLQVEAKAFGKMNGPLAWRSQTRTVTVIGVPSLAISCSNAPVRQDRSPTYQIKVEIVNTGNTPITARLHALDGRALDRDGVDFAAAEPIPPGCIDLPEQCMLAPGEHTTLPVTVTLPTRSARHKDWQVMLNAVTNRSGTSVSPHRLLVRDPGQLVDASEWGQELTKSAVQWLAHVTPLAFDWAASRSTVTRRFGMAALLVAALLGFTFGRISESPPKPQASTVPLAAPFGESPRVAITRESVSGSSPAPSIGMEDPFTTMPCPPGQYLIFLYALNISDTQPDARTAALALVHQERLRAANVAPPSVARTLAAGISASTWDQSCPNLRGTEQDPHWYIWYGPVPSESAGTQVCTELYKPQEWDCDVHQIPS
jgi:hypothetical protein